jgi:predicted nucleic acid-binding Zn ribbon protein
MTLTKCSSCGLDNPEDGKFCTGCGTALTRPSGAAAPAAAAFCTNCGAAIPRDSQFCTRCGTAAGAVLPIADPVSIGRPPAMHEFLAVLDDRLAQNGFERLDVPPLLNLDRWMRRRRFELAKGGSITAFCGVKTLDRAATAAAVRDFSRSVFDFAVSNKGFLARNAFQQLVVYPVLVASACEADVEPFLASYWNKHWMSYEYPVVVSTSTRQLAMHRSTPLWGAAFHGSFRREAESLFAI